RRRRGGARQRGLGTPARGRARLAVALGPHDREVPRLGVAHGLEVVDSHCDAVLLDHHPTVERVELGQHGSEVDRALAERTEEALLPGLIDTGLTLANASEYARIDVLQVQMGDPVARAPRELDGVAAADDRVPRVEAELHDVRIRVREQ